MSDDAAIRVLLVDDDEDEFVLARQWLADVDARGFRIDWIPDYEAARRAIAARTHDVYLVDYRLGAHSGLELLQGWPDEAPEIPVVMLTGAGNRDVDLEAMRLGATSYLTKAELNGRVLERTIRYTLEIQRARLAQRSDAERLRRYGEQQARLAELGRSVATTTDARGIIEEAARLAAEGLRAEGGAFLESTPGATDLVVRAACGSLAALDGAVVRIDHAWPAAALGVTGPVAWEPGADGAPVFEPWRLSGAMSVGVRGHTRALGALVVVGMDGAPASETDRGFFEAAAQMLAQTLERRYAIAEQESLRARLRRSEVMSAMGDLVAGVAHETRNPLFGIMATVDAFASRFGVREDMRPYLDVLKKEAGRLNAVMTDLIEYGRPRRPELTRQSFAAVVAEAIGACGILAERADVTIAATTEPDVPAIEMDAHRLTHALQNVIQNAIQYAPPGSTVGVDAGTGVVEGHPAVVCRVRDSGPGFAHADLPRVFDPFFSRRSGGTGLGLAIVRRVVEEHSGVINAANGPDGGGVVTIALPTTSVS